MRNYNYGEFIQNYMILKRIPFYRIFLVSGDSSAGLHRRNFYERANEVVRCSERKTYCVLCICCIVLLVTALIIALAPLRTGI